MRSGWVLVAQDCETAISALTKLAAGSRAHDVNIEEFLEQGAEFELDATGFGHRIHKYLLPSDSHPILVVRAAELDRWVRRGEYARILDQRDYQARQDDRGARLRDNLRSQITAAADNRRQKTADRHVRKYGLQSLREPGQASSDPPR